ncbi:hypothetical protein KUTeg_004088, partial [Tegillarca granosa]
MFINIIFILFTQAVFLNAEYSEIKPCCVPSFFGSNMDVTGAFLNSKGSGVPVDRLSHLYYDYSTNKTRIDVNITLPDGTKFAHTEIADYSRHITYKIDGNICHVITFNDTIQDRCIPSKTSYIFTLSYAKLESVSRVGSESRNVEVHTWRYIIPGTQIIVKRAVMAGSCIPVYQMQYGLIDG